MLLVIDDDEDLDKSKFGIQIARHNRIIVIDDIYCVKQLDWPEFEFELLTAFMVVRYR